MLNDLGTRLGGHLGASRVVRTEERQERVVPRLPNLPYIVYQLIYHIRVHRIAAHISYMIPYSYLPDMYHISIYISMDTCNVEYQSIVYMPLKTWARTSLEPFRLKKFASSPFALRNRCHSVKSETPVQTRYRGISRIRNRRSP